MHLQCLPIVSFIIINFTLIVIRVDGYSKAPPRLALSKSKSNPVIYLAGSKVQLQCPVYAHPQRMIVEWMRNNVPVDHIHRYFVTLNGYLRIEFAQIEDSGVYTCKAVNGYGSVDANVTLSILSERDLSEQRFTSVGNNRMYHNHQLNINHNNININNHNSHHTINSNNNNHNNAVNSHNRHYLHSFVDENGESSNPFDSDSDYDDLQSPYFLTPPTTKVIKKNSGKPLRLRCNVDGKPKPEIIWYKNGSPLSSSTPKLSEGILNFDETRLEDSGYYMCVATNPKGQINATFSVTIADKVNRPEMIGINPENKTVLMGQTTFFECQFRSKLDPVVKWLKEVTTDELEEEPDEDRGILVEIDGAYFKSLKSSSSVYKRDGIYYHRLVIDSVDRTDSGKYLCSVVNYKGYAYGASYLTVASSIEMNQLRDLGFQGINYCTILIVVIATIGLIVLITVLIFFLVDRRGGSGSGLDSGLKKGFGIGNRLMDPIGKSDPSAKYPILEERYRPSCYHHHVKHLQPPTPIPSSSSNNVIPHQSTTVTSASTSRNHPTHSNSYANHYSNHHHHHHHYQNGSTDYQRPSKEYASYQKITNAIIHDKSSSPSTIRSLGVI